LQSSLSRSDRFADYFAELRAFFFTGQALWAMVLGHAGGFVCALLRDWHERRETRASASYATAGAAPFDILQSRSDEGG
jgi:hypothetical protein